MRKLLCLLLCFLLLLGLAGCGPLSAPADKPAVLLFGDDTGPAPPPAGYLNPLTGLYDRDTPYTGRPFAVSVNNIDVSLPQSGISVADIMVEIETEGGITRLMCLYTQPELALGGIGSIRSLRHQFVYAVAQWDPVIVHIGASDYTDEYIAARGIRTMNGYYSESFLYIDADRRQHYDTEHTKFTDYEHLMAGMQDPIFSLSPTWSPVSATAFSFAESPVVPQSGDAARVRFSYSNAYDADFAYVALTGKYYKYQHGDLVVDAGADNAPVGFDNLLVLFAPINGLYGDLVDVDYSGGGQGYYFCGGRYEAINWQKDAYNQNFVFYGADGSVLSINPGTTHLSVVSTARAGSLDITAHHGA